MCLVSIWCLVSVCTVSSMYLRLSHTQPTWAGRCTRSWPKPWLRSSSPPQTSWPATNSSRWGRAPRVHWKRVACVRTRQEHFTHMCWICMNTRKWKGSTHTAGKMKHSNKITSKQKNHRQGYLFLFFSILVHLTPTMVMDNGNISTNFSVLSSLLFQYSWYFLEALVKSMAQYLIESGRVKVG